jgi:hypothetical protein
MALRYRCVAFGQPKGPWRIKKSQAVQDAVAAGLAERDEWGDLYLDCGAAIVWQREEQLRLSA